MRQPLPTVERAPEASFSAHYAQILRYVRSVVRNVDEAEDLTHETFLRAYRARDSLRDPDAMLPWLYSVATHVCLDRLRQCTRQAQARSDVDPEAVSPPDPRAERGAGRRAGGHEHLRRGLHRRSQRQLSRGTAYARRQGTDGARDRRTARGLNRQREIRLHRARKQLQSALEAGCEFSQNQRGTLVCDPKG